MRSKGLSIPIFLVAVISVVLWVGHSQFLRDFVATKNARETQIFTVISSIITSFWQKLVSLVVSFPQYTLGLITTLVIVIVKILTGVFLFLTSSITATTTTMMTTAPTTMPPDTTSLLTSSMMASTAPVTTMSNSMSPFTTEGPNTSTSTEQPATTTIMLSTMTSTDASTTTPMPGTTTSMGSTTTSMASTTTSITTSMGSASTSMGSTSTSMGSTSTSMGSTTTSMASTTTSMASTTTSMASTTTLMASTTTSMASTTTPMASTTTSKASTTTSMASTTASTASTTMTTGPTKVVFVLNDTIAAGFGGPDEADAICSSAATSGNLPGTFKAWLSTTSVRVLDRFVQSVDPYVLVNGTVIATSFASLVSTGMLLFPIILDQNGEVVPDGRVWTGTGENGDSGPTDCNGWTSLAGGCEGAAGIIGATSSQWTFSGPGDCDIQARLYCFEQ